MFEAGKYYPGVVTSAGMGETKDQHLPLLWLKIKTTEGTISWEQPMTKSVKSLAFIAKALCECFPITIQELATDGFLADTLPGIVTGKDVTVVPESKQIRPNEPPEWSVKWLNPSGFHRKPASREVVIAAAAMFRLLTTPASTPRPSAGDWGGNDSDLPF